MEAVSGTQSDPLEKYLNAPVFAFDIETDTSNYHWESGDRGLAYPADITHISFYTEGLEPLVFAATPIETSYIYHFFNRNTLEFEQHEGVKLEWNFASEEVEFIEDMFERENYTAIAHNLVFDARQVFGKFNLTIPESASFWDTLAIHVFGAWGNPEETEEEASEKIKESFKLYNLTYKWLPEEDQIWWSSFKGQRGNLTKLITDSKRREKFGIDANDIERYVAIDSIMAYRLYEWQLREIEENGYDAQYDEKKKIQTDSMVDLLRIELEYIKLCITLAVTGVRANIPYLHDEMKKYVGLWKENLEHLGLTLETEYLSRNRTWQQEYIFSRISPSEDQKVIQDHKLKTATGAWSFNKDALAYYMESYPDLIYLRYHMDLETKIEQIQNFLRHSEHDGRVHFILSRATVTGRNAGSSPNTQNLMMKHKTFYPKGSLVEKPGVDAGYLIADEGKQLISLDCSNGENWFAALYARDDAMALACAAADFHTVMASTAYFADQWSSWNEEERKGWRAIGKNITFGTAYGMGLERLAQTLSISYEDAREMIANRDKKFWRVAQAKQRSSAFAAQNGYTVLWTGRQVNIRKGRNRKTGAIEIKSYTAWNSLAQGGLGELITRAMLGISEFLSDKNSRIVTQIHDEIVLEIDLEEYYAIIIPVIEILSTRIPQLWNSRTTPECRWLFTLDNIENSHKWGYNPHENYRLPLDHYVNRWGFHQYPQGVNEAPTWINPWGYGELALQKELGIEVGIPDVVVSNSFEWEELRQSFTEIQNLFNVPVRLNGRVFVFPENLIVLQELFHKQGDKTYSEILEALDKLSALFKRYDEWRG